MGVLCYVAVDGDNIGAEVGREALSDDVEGLRRVSQDIDRGNLIWRSWVESKGGQVISLGGDEGCFSIPAEYLHELADIRAQYAETVGASVSVGVGMKLSEASKALMAAKLQGKNRVCLFGPDTEEVLAQAVSHSEESKIADHYLGKADDGGNDTDSPESQNSPSAGGGFMAPQSEEQPPPEEPPPHVARAHQLAQKQAVQAKGDQQDAQKQEQGGDLRSQVVQILQQVKQHGPELEVIKGQNPELYQSLLGLVGALVAMGRELLGKDQDTSESANKSEKIKVLPEDEDFPGTKRLNKDLMPGGKGDDAGDAAFDSEALKAGTAVEMKEHGLDEARAREIAKDHLSEDPEYYAVVEKAALEAGKTGRHQVVLAVGSQKDPGPSAQHDSGKVKVRTAAGETKWRSVRAGLVMAPDGSPTSSRHPNQK